MSTTELSFEYPWGFEEFLAETEHERWSDWMKWVFEVSMRNPDGSVTIPPGLVERWTRQMNTPYDDLSYEEKEKDREQVARYWEYIDEMYDLIEELRSETVGAITAQIEELTNKLPPHMRRGVY